VAPGPHVGLGAVLSLPCPLCWPFGVLAFLWADSPQGRAYLSDVSWAIDYAQQNRRTMVAVVADLVEDLFGVPMDEGSPRATRWLLRLDVQPAQVVRSLHEKDDFVIAFGEWD
jgi:RNA-splicing ligase RtcB